MGDRFQDPEDAPKTLTSIIHGGIVFGYRRQQSIHTHHLIHVESAQCSACGKLKFCFLELPGIFFPEYFWSMVGWICGYETHGYESLTVLVILVPPMGHFANFWATWSTFVHFPGVCMDSLFCYKFSACFHPLDSAFSCFNMKKGKRGWLRMTWCLKMGVGWDRAGA